jgi:hypothetical protein
MLAKKQQEPPPEPSFAEQFAAAAAKFKADYAALTASGDRLLKLEVDYLKACHPDLPRQTLEMSVGRNRFCTCVTALEVAEKKHD